MLKKGIRFFLAAVLTTITLAQNFAVVPVEASTVVLVSEAESRSANLIWYYKTVDGKKYCRLFNVEQQKWVTDWILCE